MLIGFVTVKGGHRVGITGSCVIDNGKIINIKYINSLNFRISRQIIGASSAILKYILDEKNNSVYNTLIVSPPGFGKTTILRDISRQISNGINNKNFSGINVGIVDERGEIAALYKGIPQNDVGLRTDVIENTSKVIGIKILIRTMAPKVIIADEIGNEDDSIAINYAMCSGCKGIFSAHGSSFEDLYLNNTLKKIINLHLFEVIIFLTIEKNGKEYLVYSLNKKSMQYEKISLI